MTQSMEFWGVEVKSGEPISAAPGDDKVIHLSQACLGEVKKGNESESVNLFVNIGGQKHVLGRLNREKFPQISFDLVFEKEFELSHNWKNGSVYFCGYKSEIPSDLVTPSEDCDFEEYPVHEELPVVAVNNELESEAKPVAQKANASKSVSSSAKQKVKIVEPKKDDGTSTEDSESDDSDAEDQVMANGESMSDDDDESEDDESSDEEEETPKKKVEQSKKRPMESASKTPAPEKKAKFVTPQKTDGKKGVVHVATPYPSKQASKASASNEQAKAAKLPGPKSSGDIACKSCSRSFKTEQALQAHSKAKHSAAA